MLDDDRKRPAERDESTSAYREQQRVADCEANGDAERARPLNGRCITGAANRKRRNRHEVIGAKTMEKAESKGGRNQEHQTILSEPNDSKKGRSLTAPALLCSNPTLRSRWLTGRGA